MLTYNTVSGQSALNIYKCKYLVFSRLETTQALYQHLHIAGIYLENLYSIRNLGMIVDSRMDFRKPYEYIQNKRYKIRIRRHINDFINFNTSYS